jgi:hypothetical protein
MEEFDFSVGLEPTRHPRRPRLVLLPSKAFRAYEAAARVQLTGVKGDSPARSRSRAAIGSPRPAGLISAICSRPPMISWRSAA